MRRLFSRAVTALTLTERRAATALLLMLLTTATAWAEDITTNIYYNGLTASDVTFTLSGNDTSFELKNGETKSVGDIFFDATFTITCNNPKNIDIEVSYSGYLIGIDFNSTPLSLTPNGNGCFFNWSQSYPDLTLNITVTPGEAPQEGITITQNGSVNMPVSGDITVNIPDGVTKFYVYDDGGPSGNFSDGCNGQVLLIAPEGKVLKVNGTVTGTNQVSALARLALYDGSSTSATMLYQSINGSVSNITSSGKQMLLHFYDIDNVRTETAAGLSLTVEVVEPTTAHSITIAGGLTHGTVTADKTSAMAGETVTLTVTTDVGYELGNITGVTLNSIGNNQYTFIMPVEDVTISASFHVSSLFGYKYIYGDIFNNYNPDGSADYPYIISTADGWNLFCDCLAEEDNTTWNRFSGKTVCLDANIEVSRMAGSQYHDFCGTFDGQGNTLTFNYTTTEGTERVAPFSYVSNVDNGPAAVIRRLNVVANITTNGQYAGGIVGEAWGQLTIEHCTVGGTITTTNKYAGGIIGQTSNSKLDITDCRSSIAISSSVSGDGTHSGILASVASSSVALNITGCLFDGKLLTTNGTTNCGGFVGWGNATITNCLYAPATIMEGETEVGAGTIGQNPSATFVRSGNNAFTLTNSYYTRQLGTVQGKAPLAVTAGEDVTVESVSPVGSPTSSDDYNGVYTVSGITAYAKGITRTVGQTTTFYYGQGDQVGLTLSSTAPLGYQYTDYSFSGGATLADGVLTLGSSDVTVSVDTSRPRSTGQAVSVGYVLADGTEQEAQAVALDGTEDDLEAGIYFVGLPTVSFDHTLELTGDVTLILCDGCTMNVGTSDVPIDGNGNIFGIESYNTLEIFGQANGNGNLKAYISGDGIYAIRADALIVNGGIVTANATGTDDATAIYAEEGGGLTINGGTVNATATGTASSGIWCNGTIDINGGTFNASGSEYDISAARNITISGGNVTAKGSVINCASGTITLGWTKPTDRIYANSYDGTLALADGKAFVTDDATPSVVSGTLAASAIAGKTLSPCLQLADDADNGATIGGFSGKAIAVQLQGRKLWKDGDWNTLCLPFALGNANAAAGHHFDGTPLEGADVRTLSSTSFEGGTLTLDFTPAEPTTSTIGYDPNTVLPVTTIEAGRPYIVKWAAQEPDYVENPVFTGVTISTATTPVETGWVDFIGSCSPVALTPGDKSVLFLGAGNTLYWPNAANCDNGTDEDTTDDYYRLNANRAYFQLKDGLTAGESSAPNAHGVRAFNLNFGEGEQTGIHEITDHTPDPSPAWEGSGCAWYTLDGRKLSGKPTKSGVYVSGGRKVVVK